MINETISVPACFWSGEKRSDDQPVPSSASRSPQSVIMSLYQTKIAGQCRLVTITWCKNLLLHGLSISVDGPGGDHHYHCKVELKPWYFWRKQGSKHFLVDGKMVDVLWDLKAAKFNGEVEPQCDYYVAIVCEGKVVLATGDQKKEAFRKTGCRPSLTDPILVSRKEHMFGKKKFSTKIKLHERERSHEVLIECTGDHNSESTVVGGKISPEMEIRIDGQVAAHVKHLEWKFRGNEFIDVDRRRIEVYWDVHDWLFGSGLRNALFLFKPSSLAASSCSSSSSLQYSSALHQIDDDIEVSGGGQQLESQECCFFLYAWKVE